MSGSFKKLFAKVKESLTYKKEKTKIDFTIELDSMMKKRDMKRADLARSLGKSNAYITKILRGESNFTIETMVELAHTLDSDVAIHLCPKEEYSADQWFRVIHTTPTKRKAVRASLRNRKIECVVEPMKSTGTEEENGYAFAA